MRQKKTHEDKGSWDNAKVCVFLTALEWRRGFWESCYKLPVNSIIIDTHPLDIFLKTLILGIVHSR
jgi:hypothetical protein